MAWKRADDALKRGADCLRDVFTFSAGAVPAIRYSFAPRSPSIRSPSPMPLTKNLKRQRPIYDVDGDAVRHEAGKKKRRLRLTLVTSRLSSPFSSPSTHIVDKGQSKIAVWAKQKAIGRMLLRKAAILNRMRRQALEERAVQQRELEERALQQRELEAARQSFLRLQQASTTQIPRRAHIPLPPSPLGLSNYDAFDLEDDIYRDADELEDDTDGPILIYSDFNILDHSEPVVEDHDSLEEHVEPQAPKSPKLTCQRDAELVDERVRQKRLIFVPFVC